MLTVIRQLMETISLRATVSGGTVTYSWVADN